MTNSTTKHNTMKFLKKPVYHENGVISFLDFKGAPYDKKAAFYEKLVKSKIYNRIFWGTEPRDYIAFAQRLLEIKKGKIIDIGCGGLVHTQEVYSKLKIPLVLMDASLEMLLIAQKRIENSGVKKRDVYYIQGDALSPPFKKLSFQTAVSYGVLHLFEDKSKFLDSFFSLLRKRGTFFISMLTTSRRLSRGYIHLLAKRKEFAKGISPQDAINLFHGRCHKLNWELKGSMLFLWGEK